MASLHAGGVRRVTYPRPISLRKQARWETRLRTPRGAKYGRENCTAEPQAKHAPSLHSRERGGGRRVIHVFAYRSMGLSSSRVSGKTRKEKRIHWHFPAVVDRRQQLQRRKWAESPATADQKYPVAGDEFAKRW